MKYIKKYEGWFRDLFKDKKYNMWDDIIANKMEEEFGYTKLMSAAQDGNFKKFKYYFSDYVDNLDGVKKVGDDSGVDQDENYLHIVVYGKGIVSDKIKMLEMLIDHGVNMFDEVEGKTFYEIIKEPKLKKWVEETHPDFVEELKLKRETQKYNL